MTAFGHGLQGGSTVEVRDASVVGNAKRHVQVRGESGEGAPGKFKAICPVFWANTACQSQHIFCGTRTLVRGPSW